jgi:hypothetical protein
VIANGVEPLPRTQWIPAVFTAGAAGEPSGRDDRTRMRGHRSAAIASELGRVLKARDGGARSIMAWCDSAVANAGEQPPPCPSSATVGLLISPFSG